MAMISAENRGLRLVTRYAVLVLIAIIFVFPLVFMLMSSLKPDQQLLADTASLRAFLPVGDISFAPRFPTPGENVSISAKISTVADLDKLISRLQEIKATITDGDEIEFDLNLI